MKRTLFNLLPARIAILASLVFSSVACGDGALRATALQPALAQSGSPGSVSGSPGESSGDARQDNSGNGSKKSDAPVVFRFGMRGSPTEDFLASTTDAQVIAKARQQLQLPESSRQLHINGRIDRAKKKANLNWSWKHIDSGWDVVEVSIEVCDGRPSFVESDLVTWLALGQFCPAASYVKGESSKGSR